MDEYNDDLAESYLNWQDRNGDPYGEKFNGGVILAAADTAEAPESPGASGAPNGPAALAPGEVRVKIDMDNPPRSFKEGEDPLFERIVGDNRVFVSGMPKGVWDGLSPEQKDRFVRGREEDRQAVGYVGATLGSAAGTAAGIPALAVGPVGLVAAGGLAGLGGVIGYNKGYGFFDNATPPAAVSRETLRQHFEFAKTHD